MSGIILTAEHTRTIIYSYVKTYPHIRLFEIMLDMFNIN